MHFITIRDLRSRSAELWQRLSTEKELIVTSNGRPIAILSAIGEGDVEQTLAALRQARAVLAVTEAQRRSLETGTDRLTDEEIEAEIAAVRRRRGARAG